MLTKNRDKKFKMLRTYKQEYALKLLSKYMNYAENKALQNPE